VGGWKREVVRSCHIVSEKVSVTLFDCGRSRRHNVEDWGWSHRSVTRWSGDRDVGWRCVQSAPCT
jgi:hypothetical protein